MFRRDVGEEDVDDGFESESEDDDEEEPQDEQATPVLTKLQFGANVQSLNIVFTDLPPVWCCCCCCCCCWSCWS